MIPRYIGSLFLTLVLTACSGPGYYVQAISGQWQLMHARQDIQALIDDPATSPALSDQLQAAASIKEFAADVLGLPGAQSYTTFVEVDGTALVWNVVAAPEFSLQPKKWCFPVAGCVPYRGYFEQQKALESAARLERKGLDVSVSPAAAYSSLGWFDDPLLSTMISGPDTRLAAYLFHELAHQRLYRKGDSVFNEGYARFVEESGVTNWLESQNRHDELRRWKQLREFGMDFVNLIKQARDQLSDLYRSNQSETAMKEQKAEILAALPSSYQRLSDEKWQGERLYDSWFKEPLNNARLALFNTYSGSTCAFARLMAEAGGEWQEFHRLAMLKSRLPDIEREEWLKQPCTAIAPHGDL